MDKIEAKLAFDLGTQFYGEGKLEEALSYYNKALELFQKLDDKQKEADILLEIGDIQVELSNFDDAHKKYEKSLNLYNEINDYIGSGYSLAGLGIIVERYKKYEEARDYYEKALKKFQKAEDYERAGIISNLIANTYEMQDALEDALIDYKRSLELFGKVKDHKREAEIYEAITKIEKKKSENKTTKKNILVLIGYLIALGAAELTTTYLSMQVGLIAETTILFALLIHSSLYESYTFSNLLRSMMVLPMIRIIGLSLPIMQVPSLYWFPIIAIPLFAASYTLMRNQRLNRKKVGLILGNIPVQLLIALTGLALGFIEFLILKPQPLISTFSIVPLLTAVIILTISTGFAEELLFRGILQRNAENVVGKAFGLLYTSLLFTGLHIGWHSFLDLIFVFIVAMFYGYMFQKTRSIVGITLSHGLSNSVLFLVMPFVVFNLPF
jgi:membrane protease YdiL (CAAX protease family)/ribosomal protein S21